ncbi:N-acetyltransferase [Desulfovibrio sp. OttesenSCG-928-G11]|nr:N-acetyltransferase [Desulfovibrio sp. OttesenSCG-928-G11]
MDKDYFVHESAYVDDGCEIGKGTRIWHFSHILPGSRIGTNCNLGQNVVVGPDVVMGSGCKVQNNVSIYKGVIIEDNVFCGPSMVFTNVFNPRAFITRMDEARPTLIKYGASMGANCTIVCGVTVGRFAFVGAGAVVTRDVPDHALVYGSPAVIKAWVCECGEKLDEDFSCRVCSLAYEKSGQGLKRLSAR